MDSEAGTSGASSGAPDTRVLAQRGGQAPGSEGEVVITVVAVHVWGMFVSGLTSSVGGRPQPRAFLGLRSPACRGFRDGRFREAPGAASSKSLWLLAPSQRAVAGPGGCPPAGPGTAPRPVPTPGNHADSAGRALSGPCAANSATGSPPPARLPTL